MTAHHIQASQLQIGIGGTYTGELTGRQTIGEGKAVAIRDFLALHHTQSSDCLAFGDDISDLPMLECVGQASVIGEGTPLAAQAA